MNTSTSHKHFVQFFTTIGILLFLSLYYYASTLYPGGSQANLTSVGFDWMHNYWCNLLNEQAMNGQLNPARPIAITALFLLCLSLAAFFMQFANKLSTNRLWKMAIQRSGAIALFFTLLIFTQFHDLMTTLASLFGSVTVIGIIWSIHKSKMSLFKWSGVLCILLMGLNNYIYYSEHWLAYLPFIQKITFVIVLAWVAGLNLKLTYSSIRH